MLFIPCEFKWFYDALAVIAILMSKDSFSIAYSTGFLFVEAHIKR